MDTGLRGALRTPPDWAPQLRLLDQECRALPAHRAQPSSVGTALPATAARHLIITHSI